MSRHIIHKQKVTLRISKKEDAHFLQTRVSDLLQNELSGQMESIFDDLFPSDKIIRIESLVLDLGSLNSQNFEQEFRGEFIKALVKALSSKKDDVDSSNNSQVLSNAQSLVNSLIYFLEKGYLPWYRAAEKTTVWENELLNNFSAYEYAHFLDWLKDNYQHNPIIIERLILQFSDALLRKLLDFDAPSIKEKWELIYQDYAYVLKNWLRGRRTSRYEIWKYLFHVLLINKDDVWAFQVLKLLADHFGLTSSGITITQALDINRKLKTIIVKEAFNSLVLFLKNQDELLKPDENNTDENQITKWKRITNQAETHFAGPQDNGKELTVGWSKAKKRKWEAEEDTLYVINSGVVILHFFLRPFFEDLKLVKAGKFKNDKTRQRAVLLLHYLATGEPEVAEFDLALQKILCGYPLQNTLPKHIVLTGKEKAEANKLLNAVVDYWEPLRNTSVEGLQNTFLKRNGKLLKKENGWQLVVEQKTVDILLGKIPWGFSTIRLPWMEEILNVDWY
ncbi:MAG: contractile injection system tape measure protein [Mucilaginibacter sp.]